jgi:hypothetical protein
MQAETPHSQVHLYLCQLCDGHGLWCIVFVHDVTEAKNPSGESLRSPSEHCWIVQAQGGPSDFSFQPPGLQRSNSEPNMRLMLASPLATMPQQMFPQPFPAFGSSSTAGALVPYKAQEVHLHA